MTAVGKTITVEVNYLKAEGKDEISIAQHIMQRLFDQAYEVIGDGEAYRSQYKDSTSYGKYEVTAVREPRWNGPELIFYAVLKEKQLPYKVTFSPEQNGNVEECSLELLSRES